MFRIRFTRCQSPFSSMRSSSINIACCLSMGHESNASASEVAPQRPASLPCRRSRVAAVRSCHLSELIATTGLLILRNFSFERRPHFVGNVVKPQTDAAARIAVDHFGIANDLSILAKRYSHHQESAFGNTCLGVHVETAWTDVFRAGDTGHVLTVEIDVQDQSGTIMRPAFVLRLMSFLDVVGHVLPPPTK